MLHFWEINEQNVRQGFLLAARKHLVSLMSSSLCATPSLPPSSLLFGRLQTGLIDIVLELRLLIGFGTELVDSEYTPQIHSRRGSEGCKWVIISFTVIAQDTFLFNGLLLCNILSVQSMIGSVKIVVWA